ncbi:MAG: gliding motility protein GldN, partial [Bacteroidia bacterium]|nr:gliding motility protein GldN [Bacteroidia bacterium]
MKKVKILLSLLVTLLMFADITAQEVLKAPKYPDGVYVKENTRTRRAIPYTHLREADVMWSKRVWRVIDLREKI